MKLQGSASVQMLQSPPFLKITTEISVIIAANAATNPEYTNQTHSNYTQTHGWEQHYQNWQH